MCSWKAVCFPYQSWRQEQYRTVIIDITERKQMEKEQEALRVGAYQSHKMKSIRTIAGGIAHDFNNILFIIIGSVDWHLKKPSLASCLSQTRKYPDRCRAGRKNCQAAFELSQASDENKPPWT